MKMITGCAGVLLALVVGATAQGAVLLADDFGDNDYTASPAWFKADNSSSVNNPTTPPAGVIGINSSSNFFILGVSFDPFTLTNEGDSIRVTLDLKRDQNGGNRNVDYLVYLGTKAGTATPYTDDQGYGMELGYGTGDGQLAYDGGGNRGLGWLDTTVLGAAMTDNSWGVIHTAWTTFSLSITKTASGADVNVTTSRGSGLSYTFSDSSLQLASYDLLTIAEWQRSDGYLQVDNVAVEGQSVPEPGSLGLMGLGVAGLLLRRRRT